MVHDVVEDEHGLYLVMELAERGSLSHRLREEGPLSPQDAVGIIITMSKALSVAHKSGVIHRDIKPDNVLFDRHGMLKLADFGIARVAARNPHLTQTGMVIGTWAYMPPEQRESARQVDGRSDIYALGATLYRLVSGQTSSTLHNKETHVRALKGIPDSLAQVIIRCTRFEPHDRYASCEELLSVLEVLKSALGTEPLFEPMHEELIEDPLPLISDIIPTMTRSPDTSSQTAVPLLADQMEASSPRPPSPGTITPITQISIPVSPSYVIAGLTAALLMAGTGAALMIAAYVWSDQLTSLATSATPSPTDTPALVTDASQADSEPAGGTAEPTEPDNRAEPVSQGTPDPPPPQEPSSGAAPVEPASAGGQSGRMPRIITVVPSSGRGSAAGPELSVPNAAQADASSGLLMLRTVPSGVTVLEHGQVVPRKNGGYVLSEGGHVLTLRSTSGESTTMRVKINYSGQTIEMCYNFDTNSTCQG
jgi:serine/threonine protein kinase